MSPAIRMQLSTIDLTGRSARVGRILAHPLHTYNQDAQASCLHYSLALMM
jgi:hypothetical protein